jgi:hypothetical protein
LRLGVGVLALTTTVNAASSIVYTPPLWSGNAFVATPFSDLTNVLKDSAVGDVGPAAVQSDSHHDLFI